MQIRLSWQRLLALILFVIALGVLGVAFFPRSRSESAVAEATPRPTGGEPQVQAFFATGTAQALPTEPPTATVTPTSTPTPTFQPIPTLAPIPTAFDALGAATVPPITPQSEAPAQAPTNEPTPIAAAPTAIPEPLRLISLGFGQQKDFMSYAFIVENPSATQLTRDTLYQIAAYDEAGTVLRTESSFIDLVYPGQQIAVAKVLTMPPDVQIARVEVQFRQRTFAEATGQIPQLEVENPAFIPNPEEFPRVTGVIRNTLDRDLVDLPVVGIAYDGDEIVGGGTTVIPFVSAQSEAAVSIPIATSRMATRVTIFPRLDPVTEP